ncbi:hypothetical protein D9757_011782 [Collybiopsis confluens]|uniref:Uncharacterized protein n=1 Tax=Collybiopsis confluens TaxID=2823264 RepID=A0A8H5LZ48_9AGAR|nr:hypothetical protein D9757_011782 [Collybiopsis confluens]
MMYKCWEGVAWRNWLTRIYGSERPSGDIVIFYIRDGMIFFFIVFLAEIFGAVLTVRKSVWAGLPIPWQITAFSISGAKLILNLREAADPAMSATSAVAGGSLNAWRVHAGTSVSL